MKATYDNEIDPSVLAGRPIGVLGFGAQGRAHALNLRDSGADVRVGLRDGSPSSRACAASGLAVVTPERLAEISDLVVMLVPDEVQPALYDDVLAPRMKRGAALVFAHGYSIHYGQIRPRPDLDVILVAPLGIGEQVRRTYAAGNGVPALLAVHQDATGGARELGLAYAGLNGHGRAGVLATTVADETETDLFAEQAVLCGGVTHLITAAFETLVEAGYPEELAYFGCLHELKLITDLIQARGIAGMRVHFQHRGVRRLHPGSPGDPGGLPGGSAEPAGGHPVRTVCGGAGGGDAGGRPDPRRRPGGRRIPSHRDGGCAPSGHDAVAGGAVMPARGSSPRVLPAASRECGAAT